jgi:hypothetical protein
MKRENRYLVIKRKDIHQHLSLNDQLILYNLAQRIEEGRKADGRAALECVVVESDWPEYEPTWAAIAAHVDALSQSNNEDLDLRHYCDNGYWWRVRPHQDGIFEVTIGQREKILEMKTTSSRNKAYEVKNHLLTKYGMFCSE